MHTPNDILCHFHTEGTIATVEPLGHGLINDTYRVATTEPDRPDYVLQRINTTVFTDVDALQRNISIVTAHLRQKLAQRGVADLDRRVLRFIETDSGLTYWRQPDTGACWRLSVFISDADTLETVDEHSSREAGRAFGDYELMLSDLPEGTLAETIPQFHNMELRLRQLHEAIAADAAGRAKGVSDFTSSVLAHADAMCLGERLHREGRLQKRICHCDTKVNNMMFDHATGRFLLVIDLDTTMPSLFFSDYGDFLRSAANATAEDDPHLENVRFRDDIFRAFTEGYLQSASRFLTPLERQLLPYAAELFPYMQAVRFLWDYLSGDHYWKCLYPEHNLDRARNQMRLFEQVKAQEQMMSDFIDRPTPDPSLRGRGVDTTDSPSDKKTIYSPPSQGGVGGGSARGGSVTVKRIPHVGPCTAADVPNLLEQAGAEWHQLECVPWADDYPYRPDVSFALAHTGTEVLIVWRVSEDGVRAEATADCGHVWEDSCCELFLQPDGAPHYYNIECNCAGRLLLGCGPDRHQRQMAPPQLMAAIGRCSSLGSQPFGLRQGPCQWSLAMVIPTAALFRDAIATLSGLHARANFYKCGDRLSRPHFLSLFPIPLPRPDFHCPQHFGQLVFE